MCLIRCGERGDIEWRHSESLRPPQRTASSFLAAGGNDGGRSSSGYSAHRIWSLGRNSARDLAMKGDQRDLQPYGFQQRLWPN